jgi:ATP-dependent RNA helicase DDX54/DBP10
LNKVSGFRPKETVFEIGHKGSKGKSVAAEIMRVRRSKITIKADEPGKAVEDDSDTEDVATPTTPSLSKQSFKDPEHYIAHFQPGNMAQEHGYDVNRPAHSFAEVARGAMMNLADDDGVSLAPARPKQRWDPKKKDFVNRMNDDDGSGHKSIKMIKGESGVKIPASMKSGRYFPLKKYANCRFESWQEAHKTNLPQSGTSETTQNQFGLSGRRFKHTKNRAPKAPDRFRDDYHVQKKRAADAAESRKEGGQLRTVDQVRKIRMQAEQRKKKNARPAKRRK